MQEPAFRNAAEVAVTAEFYKALLAIKEKGAGDPLVADAQRRLSSH